MTQGEQIELSNARLTLLKPEWEATRAEKELARKIIDRLTKGAAWKGFKGQ